MLSQVQTAAVDTANDFLVSTRGAQIVGLNGIALVRFQEGISKEEALRLAAWLVALADPGQQQFQRVLGAILS